VTKLHHHKFMTESSYNSVVLYFYSLFYAILIFKVYQYFL